MDPSPTDEAFADNRHSWDERVPVHVASAFYDVEGWLVEGRGPRAEEARILGELRGLDLVHLQCHFGLDTLAWARQGARVTGVDFSVPALDHARALTERAGLDGRARFVCANVYDAPQALGHESFDVVYVSLGSLCWLPSVDRWAAVVATLLRPGGRLFVHDGHPLAGALDEHELVVASSYFEEPDADVDDTVATYTDGTFAPDSVHRTHTWNHGLGEIVNAVTRHGLRVEHLEEHDYTSFARFPWLVHDAEQHWSLPAGRPRFPLSFTLLATRPPPPASVSPA